MYNMIYFCKLQYFFINFRGDKLRLFYFIPEDIYHLLAGTDWR
jgi:hypothetical protein